MADIGGEPARDDGHYFGKLYSFQKVFEHEIETINKRRRGPTVEIDFEETDVEVDVRGGETTVHVEQQRGTVTLGAAHRPPRPQIALENEGRDVSGREVLRPNEDADVVGLALSGGGIRSAAFCLGALQALDAAKVLDGIDYMSTVSGGGYIGCSLTAALDAKPGFPFASKLGEDEPPALQQLRNYSNYLFPRGVRHTVLRNASIYARGLAVNAVLVGHVLFAASALTLLVYALRAGHAWMHFLLTAVLAAIVFAAAIAWGFVRSMRPQRSRPDYAGFWARGIGWMIVALFVVAFCELQPFVLDAMRAKPTGNVAAVLIDWKNAIVAMLAPLGAAMAYLSSKLGEYLKSIIQSPQWSAPIKAVALKAMIVAGGLILPLAIWVVYLDVTYLGLCIDDRQCAGVAPDWLAHAVNAVFPWPQFRAAALYAALAVVGLAVTLLMQPNANSLHPLYGDRLKKAFLFVPEPLPGEHDLPEFTKRLSEIDAARGPYHLINAALNVEASKTANRRGRNADFFIFSPKFVGSKTTGYVRTAEMEDVVSTFSFAAAMAASGAAVSSNMGAQNIKPLTPTLALLNVRLGYWLRNPLMLADAKPQPDRASLHDRFREFKRHRNFFANYYFVAEMFGLLSEKYKSIYLTDGGHIDNTGIYELLRRRCRVIIAVDAEADPQMAFGSFNMMERHALIDMGVRIDLPWQQIANESLATSAAIDQVGAIVQKKTDDTPVGQALDVKKDPGPHCAIGEISYPGGRKGVLIYVKASLSGDENDYVFDYKKRYSAFPHETTLEQMFTEEQFEAYRALGFHAAFRLFDRSDRFAHLDAAENPDVPGQLQLLDRLFPRADDGGSPNRKTTFAELLGAQPAAAAAAAPRTKKPRGTAKPGA